MVLFRVQKQLNWQVRTLDNYKIFHSKGSERISVRVESLLKKLITMVANKEQDGNASKVIEDMLWEGVERRGFDTSSITTTTKKNRTSEEMVEETTSLIEGPEGYEVPKED